MSRSSGGYTKAETKRRSTSSIVLKKIDECSNICSRHVIVICEGSEEIANDLTKNSKFPIRNEGRSSICSSRKSHEGVKQNISFRKRHQRKLMSPEMNTHHGGHRWRGIRRSIRGHHNLRVQYFYDIKV